MGWAVAVVVPRRSTRPSGTTRGFREHFGKIPRGRPRVLGKPRDDEDLDRRARRGGVQAAQRLFIREVHRFAVPRVRKGATSRERPRRQDGGPDRSGRWI